MFKTISPRSIAITILSTVAFMMAVLWPNWRAELRALGYYPVIVILNGELVVPESEPQLSLRLAAQVSSGKTPDSRMLYGSGQTSVLHDRGKPEEDAVQFDLEGWVTARGIVILHGKIVKSKDPGLIGQRVAIYAVEETGDITLTFVDSELTLIGEGKVMIR